ncbi:hypothetical protein JZ751_028862 [Albula glossodonta]|uniref:Uncharacterized protein n=1 Tax=Albula glossodonta TaxID=121402 RepID=A0A8T2NBG0_9TELE|nr:hypothetical protein JZ751_028862 [Albula glossodonta]
MLLGCDVIKYKRRSQVQQDDGDPLVSHHWSGFLRPRPHSTPLSPLLSSFAVHCDGSSNQTEASPVLPATLQLSPCRHNGVTAAREFDELVEIRRDVEEDPFFGAREGMSFHTPRPPTEVYWPRAVSSRKSGIPANTRVRKYGIRKAPVGEPPDVTQSDGVPHTRQQEVELALPGASVREVSLVISRRSSIQGLEGDGLLHLRGRVNVHRALSCLPHGDPSGADREPLT